MHNVLAYKEVKLLLYLGQKEAYELKKLVSQKGEIVVFFSEM
jgi:hypothetical protein